MPNPRMRIIVDGVEFASVFRFQRILGAVLSSLQPPRLIIGLLMVTALMTAGRLWDGFTEPAVPPSGLKREWSAAEAQSAQSLLRQVMLDHVPKSKWPNDDPELWGNVDAGFVLAELAESYKHWRRDADDLANLDDLDAEKRERLATVDAVRPKGAFEATMTEAVRAYRAFVRAGYDLEPRRMGEALYDLFVGLPLRLWQYQKSFVAIFGLFALIVFAVGGGALSRMSACQVALHERIRVFDAMEFALGNWVRLTLAVVLPLLIVIVACLVPILLGLLMTLPFLDVIGALAYGVALIAGFLVAFLLIGYIAGFMLLVPAVACERCDPFDAMQRAYAFVMQRPLYMAGYVLTGLVGMLLGFFLVGTIVTLTLNITAALFGMLTSHPALAGAGGVHLMDMTQIEWLELQYGGPARLVVFIVSFWHTTVKCLFAAYVIAYFASASTWIYLLMRRVCDGQDVEEIWRPGLVPGTLAPMPPTRITEAAE